MGRLIDADALSELVKEPIDVFLSRLDLKCPPIIDLEPHWIPVSERMPRDDEEVIVSCTDDSGDSKFTYTTVGWHYKGLWVVNNDRCFFVVAWMPLPEPYKED